MSPHDALFRMAFGPVSSAAALLRKVLPPALVASIRWDTLRPATPRFLDKVLGVHEADLVFTALDVDGIHVHVFVVEHKSRLRSRTVFQPLRYVVRTLEGWNEGQPAERRKGLPPASPGPMPRVHAVVVYHGPKPSRVLLEAVRHLPPHVGTDDPVRHGSLHFTVHLEDLSCASEAQIHTFDLPARARLALLLLQHLPRKDPDRATRALLRWQPALREAFGGDGDEEEFGVFAAYTLQVTKVDPEELQKLIEQMLNAKRGGKVMYTADRLRLEGRRQGLEEGLKQGIEQGIERGEDRASRRTLVRQLRLRFGDAAARVEPRIRSATQDQILRWLDRTVLAATLEDVFLEPQ